MMKKIVFLITILVAVLTSCKKQESEVKPSEQVLIKSTNLESYPSVVTKENDAIIGIFRHTNNTSDLSLKKLRINLQFEGTNYSSPTPAQVVAGIENISLWLKSNAGEQLIGRSIPSFNGPFTGATFLEEDCNPMVLSAGNQGNQLIIVKMKVKKSMPSGIKITAYIDNFDFTFFSKQYSLTITDPGANGSTKDIAALSPIIFVNSIPEIKPLPIPEIVHGTGSIQLMRFSITAGLDGDIKIRGLEFRITMPTAIRNLSYGFTIGDENGATIGIVNEASGQKGLFVSYLNTENERIAAGTTKIFSLVASTVSKEDGLITSCLTQNSFQTPCTNTFGTSINWHDGSMFLGAYYFKDLPITQSIEYYYH